MLQSGHWNGLEKFIIFSKNIYFCFYYFYILCKCLFSCPSSPIFVVLCLYFFLFFSPLVFQRSVFVFCCFAGDKKVLQIWNIFSLCRILFCSYVGLARLFLHIFLDSFSCIQIINSDTQLINYFKAPTDYNEPFFRFLSMCIDFELSQRIFARFLS